MADLLTVMMLDGAIMRLTSSDIDISYNGQTFSSNGPYFERSKTSCKVGVQVDDLELVFSADSTMTVAGQPFLQACRAGMLDWAIIKLERAFMASWGDTSAGTVIMFYGRVSDVKPGRTQAAVTVKGITDLLNIQMPRNTWQASCINALYDPNTCGVNRASFAVNGSVASGSSINVVQSNLTNQDGYFSQGSITFTSGALSGTSFSIKSSTLAFGSITPMNSLPSAPAPGDTFIAYPGCDHSNGPGGCPKFSNTRFRGMPYVPVPEMAY